MSDLEFWEHRIAETGSRIAALLATDAQAFFLETVRERFVANDATADRLDEADVVALKAATARDAAHASQMVQGALGPAAWQHAQAPEAGGDLLAMPTIAAVFRSFEALLNDFLAAHELSDPEPAQWRLPRRFIEGENLVTLTRNLFKALSERQHLQVRTADQQAASTAQARRQRWEEA